MNEKEVFDILEVENILKNCDITVRNADGSFRLMNEVLKDLAERWNECHEYIFAEIMNRHINTFCDLNNCKLGESYECKYDWRKI